MVSNEVLTYLSYVQSVLGAGSIAIADPRPRVILELRSDLPSVFDQNSVAQLFEKMLAAVGFSSHSVSVAELAPDEIIGDIVVSSSTLYMLSNDLREKLMAQTSADNILSYHPSELLKDTNLKKSSWEDLKKFQRLNS